MCKKLLTRLVIFALPVLAMSTVATGQAAARQRGDDKTQAQSDRPSRQVGMSASTAGVARDVRHELVTLPYYGVFDWLEYDVAQDGTVELRGQVVRPTTKSQAEARVKRIEGVERVVNNVSVLPTSPNDDRLRVALYRTIYGQNSPLFRYATGSLNTIHIIVERGRATLKGYVDSEGDKRQAFIRARTVPGLFDVKNELVVSGPDER